jgi:cyclophilin family peptidyl-prolyl cis-trans isomerase/HEAT repeat protein
VRRPQQAGLERAGPPLRQCAAAQDPFLAIARCEDARKDGDGLLMVLLHQAEESTRERAAVALGRLPWPEHGPEASAALASALDDPAPRVRAAVAFALGQRADPASAPVVLGRLGEGSAGEPDGLVRARLVEAASRMPESVPEHNALVARIVAALDDPDVQVRAEAALAPQRWKPAAVDAAEIDQTWIAALRRLNADSAPAAARTRGATLNAHTEVAWRIVFALARRKCAEARPLFVEALAAEDVRLRSYGAMGLAALPYDAQSQAALYRALGDPEARVVCEAVRGIGNHPDAQTPSKLEPLIAHASTQVQRLAFEAWGKVPKEARGERSLSSRALTLESSDVRLAAFVSDVQLRGDEEAPAVELRLADTGPLPRMAAAQAARYLSPDVALPLLLRAAQDDDLRVVEVACEGLAALELPAAHEKLVALLAAADNGVRLAAVEGLKTHPRVGDLEPLEACLGSSTGEIAGEIAAGVLALTAQIAQSIHGDDSVDQAARERARALFARGARHADPYVRRRACELHAQTFPQAPTLRPTAGPPGRSASLPVRGTDYASGARPRVRVETSRGALVFELFYDEAPVHVFSFLQLVQRQFYDGTSFHRVVPDFVIQGGDRRGDGNGGCSWRGDALRAEFTPRKFVRGSLGMPRNDDPDSGGSQIFVCHRETPHLDGRYTQFGELIEGFDVLDRIEVGDRILSARVLSPGGSR